MKVKIRKITLATLIALFLFVTGLAFGALAPRAVHADAATYSPSAIFAAGTGGEVGTSGDEQNYLRLTVNNGGSIYYRRDLAIKWFEAQSEPAGDSLLKEPGVAKYFSMAFAFPELNFTELSIAFEGAEENISKDALATNALVFTYAESALSVEVHNASYSEKETAQKQALTYSAGQVLSLSLAETQTAGEFAVSLQIADGEPIALEPFTNIGGNYFEYRSSASTTPCTPMTITAKVQEGGKQNIDMRSLNGQTFEIGEDGRVTDNAAPVLALNEKVYSFRLGQRFNLTYEPIDVCDDSVTVTRNYYMAKKDADGKWLKPKADSSDYATLTSSTFFMPTDENEEELAYVSVRFELDDGRDLDDPYYVYLTWYAANEENVVAKIGEGDEEYDYIKVDLEAQGPSYTVLTADPDKSLPQEQRINQRSAGYDAAVEEYQKQVMTAADGVSAGDGAYLYLPSLRGLIGSEYADYRNLRFNVYYFKPSQSATDTATSATSLRYNNLRLEVDEVGEYRMRVIAQDASGNAMKYYNKDGEYVTVTSSNIWDIDGIPEFDFDIGYKGPVIEDAKEQSLGYRDNTYNVSSFDIVALDGYETEYYLYRINEGELPEGEQLPSYSELVADAADWVSRMNEWDSQKQESDPKILVEINQYNDEVSEDDDAWERTDNAYEWDPDSSLSFRPQERGIYIVKVVVIDSYLPNTTQEAYQVIEVRNPIDTIPGQSRWLQDNLLAVILFSISGLLLIAIVVLFVVNPSDAKVEEVDLGKLKGKTKSKPKSKK